MLSRPPDTLVEHLLSSPECQRLFFLSKELVVDDEQLKVDSSDGMGLALQMVYDPWCDFRGPERTFPSHCPPHCNYWLPTQIYPSSTELLICHLRENNPGKGDILSHIRDLYI